MILTINPVFRYRFFRKQIFEMDSAQCLTFFIFEKTSLKLFPSDSVPDTFTEDLPTDRYIYYRLSNDC